MNKKTIKKTINDYFDIEENRYLHHTKYSNEEVIKETVKFISNKFNQQLCVPKSFAYHLFKNHISLDFTRCDNLDYLNITPNFVIPNNLYNRYKYALNSSFKQLNMYKINQPQPDHNKESGSLPLVNNAIDINMLMGFTQTLILSVIHECSKLHSYYVEHDAGRQELKFHNPLYDMLDDLFVVESDSNVKTVDKDKLEDIAIYFLDVSDVNNLHGIFQQTFAHVNLKMNKLTVNPGIFDVTNNKNKEYDLLIKLGHSIKHTNNVVLVDFIRDVIKETIWFYYIDPFDVFQDAWEHQKQLQISGVRLTRVIDQ